MLVGGDLGFLVRVVVTGLVVIFASVVGFVVRRKWRRSVARREEIKRLLVLASEETARAELEAAARSGYGGYGFESVAQLEADPVAADVEVEVDAPGEVEPQAEPLAAAKAPRRLQYQCEVCFSPTTTRCKQCKAVHYCSGKCQIIHWRQGHKDDCRPFAINERTDDMGDTSYQNLSKPTENKSHDGSLETERRPAKPVEISSGESGFSDSIVAKIQNRKDDIEAKHLIDEKEPASDLKIVSPSISDRCSGVVASDGSSGNASGIEMNNLNTSDRYQSAHIARNKTKNDHENIGQHRPPSLRHSMLVDHVDGIATPLKGNMIKPTSFEEDACCESSTSSISSIDGCNESSLSEPSTTSSGFWDGAIKLLRSKDIVDDTSHSFSDGAGEVDALNSETSSCCSSEMARTVIPNCTVSRSHAQKMLSDDNHPPVPDISKPRISLDSSVEVNKKGLTTQMSSFSSEKSDHLDFGDFSSRKISKSKETREPSPCGDAKNSNFSSHSPDKSKNHVAGRSGVSKERKSVELNPLSSKTSVEHLSTNTGKQTIENVKRVQVDKTPLVSMCSTDSLSHSQNAKSNSKSSVWKVVDQIRATKFTRLNSLGAAGDGLGRYSYKGQFPYELFVKLYNWSKVELHPCGLINCGNSCYANVVLQCLAFTPPLTAYFLQGLHSKACKKRDWCFTCEFEGLVLKAQEGNSPISPSRIISKLQNIGSHLGNGREEDAHEFLRYVIDTMQSVCLKEAGVSSSGSSEEETTLIGLTFGGYLRSKIECMRCGGKSERQEKMMDLTVEIDGDIGTLEEALRQFTHTETLDGENKYNCSRCKSYEKARKKLRVLEAPNVLTIALKRFQSGKFGKLNKTIKFPEILDLAPYISGTSDKSPIYRLYGVIVHLDVMNAAFSGHYVCYVKNTENKWFKIDDSSVKAMDLENVLTKGAYMLLYARCSPRAPRLLRSSLNPRDIRKTKQLDCKPRYSSRGQRDDPTRDSSSNCNYSETSCPSYYTFQPIRTILGEDSLSDNSSSFFSEVNSCSTESSNRDSTSTEDYFDQIFGDLRVSWSSPWRNSSDSETSSSSSSPSPMYSRHSDLDHYAARDTETGFPCRDGADSERRGSTSFLYPDSSKHCRKLDSSSSCRESGSSKLGWVNHIDNLKSSAACRNR